MYLASRACILTLIAATLGGCQMFGGGGGSGVMPDSDVGLPPSMAGNPGSRRLTSATVDEDGQPLPMSPTRQIALPNKARADGKTADAGPRRIRRDEINGGNATGGGGSGGGGMAPSLSASGNVGMGGQF